MQPSWPSEYVALALLCERPMHGYELYQRVRSDEALRAIWRIERSQLYFLLRKLEREGYIAELAEEQAAGPPRLIYAPTPAGRAALEAWLRRPEAQPHDLRAAFLAKLYLALRSTPDIAPALVEEQRRVLNEWAGRQRRRAAGNDFVALVHRLRLSQIEAALAWLDELWALIHAGQLTDSVSHPAPSEPAVRS